jgi:hypothetical protein
MNIHACLQEDMEATYSLERARCSPTEEDPECVDLAMDVGSLSEDLESRINA